MPTLLDTNYGHLFAARYAELSKLPLDNDLPEKLPSIESLREPSGAEETQFVEDLLRMHDRLMEVRTQMSALEGVLRQQLIRRKKPLTSEQVAQHHKLEVAGIDAFEEFTEDLADYYGTGLVVPHRALFGSLRAPFVRRGGNRETPLHSINAELVTVVERTRLLEAERTARTRQHDAATIRERILSANLDALAKVLADLLPTNPDLKRILAL